MNPKSAAQCLLVILGGIILLCGRKRAKWLGLVLIALAIAL